jgi:hypothetical protein
LTDNNRPSTSRRWSSDGTSIFSVADGRTLALTPPKEPTHFERIRAERLARAQLETPLVRGLRLMPEYTPGRCAYGSRAGLGQR